MPRSASSPGRGPGRWLGVAAGVLLLVFLGFELGRRSGSPEPPPNLGLVPATSGSYESPDVTAPRDRERPTIVVAPPDPVSSPGGSSAPPRLAIVIDDLGRNVETIQRLEALGVRLTYSVLPFEVRTAEVVEYLREQGREILCHLPMQAEGEADPGPGALEIGMSRREVKRLTREALSSVPGAVGVNNHMGSGFSAHAESMRAVLEVLGKRDLYFLDSRTSARTQGYTVALDLGLRAAERDIFLDRVRDEETISAQLDELLRLARERGAGIAIGHPYPETMRVLEGWVADAVEEDVRFVTVSELLAEI